MQHVLRNLSSRKMWDLPELPNEFDFRKPLTNSGTDFLNDIFKKKMLNVPFKDCLICTQNLLFGCERIDCEPFCSGSNLYHSAAQIANVCFHYVSLVSHYNHFTEKTKKYLMGIVSFQFKECENAETLKQIIIDNYFSSISHYYFDFLRKLIQLFDLPSDHDSLMKTVYIASTRYTKKKPMNENRVKEDILDDNEDDAHCEELPKIKKC